jgi:hypothetical protein
MTPEAHGGHCEGFWSGLGVLWPFRAYLGEEPHECENFGEYDTAEALRGEHTSLCVLI